ncbi:MAG: glycoside hydrolase family 3 N-terminal domain-containing protein [Solirubrobacteraceae bacterium]
MSGERSPTGLSREASVRRRRLTAVVLVIALALAIVVVVSAGSGGSAPKFVFRGAGSVSVIAPQVTSSAPRARSAVKFRAAPAAVSLAATLPLARQVSQLFLVTLDGRSSSGVAALGSLDWGGVVLGASNFPGGAQASPLVSAVAGALSGAGHLGPLLAATQAGGPGTALPDLPPRSEPAVGASGDPVVARAQAVLAAKRLRSLGFNMSVAPLADVDTPGGPLSGRLFSSDPATVASLSVAAVTGYTAENVISAPGHFPGTGGASADPDQMTATVGGSLAGLRARDLVPFVALAPKAPVMVMANAAYAAFDGVTPAGLLRPAVELLRRDYGFQGVVMSDDLDATLQATGGDAGTSALAALRAGDDLLYLSGPPSERQAAYAAVLAAAQRSDAIRAAVHAALLRVLSLKARFGIVR